MKNYTYSKIFLVGKPSYYLLRPWEFFKDTYREIKSFLQRGYRGYADNDVWGLDEYLSRVISETTGHLAKNTSSYPGGMTFSNWKKILRQISKDIQIKDHYKTEKEQSQSYAKQQEALKLFVKYFCHLWD